MEPLLFVLGLFGLIPVVATLVVGGALGVFYAVLPLASDARCQRRPDAGVARYFCSRIWSVCLS